MEMYTVPPPRVDGSSSRQAYTDEACMCGDLSGSSNESNWQTIKTTKKAPKTLDAMQSKDLDASHKNTHNRYWPLALANAPEDSEPPAKDARVFTQFQDNNSVPHATSPTSSPCLPEAPTSSGEARWKIPVGQWKIRLFDGSAVFFFLNK
eukprot:CAMPEP_0185546354 /NCGR_PEP_ID=MMETSP1381-20130426/5418_1 /TAXON_ID=298111 /ORGANISM="Pavlova sp., Strain CCMP459" /LENGTH=149 /DNA_ID=CAMNT_0028158785 /DNA_START=770 /DNA_END=1217 /DNA_ORIENTATION=+